MASSIEQQVDRPRIVREKSTRWLMLDGLQIGSYEHAQLQPSSTPWTAWRETVGCDDLDSWLRMFNAWVESVPESKPLPDEAMRRENIY